MDIRVVPTKLPGVFVVEPQVIRDARGIFLETYHRQRYVEHGMPGEFVQDNHSRSTLGVLRGIHFQDLRAPMAKLVRCSAGRLFDVVVDLRAGGPTFGQWIGVELSAEKMNELYIPIGFGHGFLALSDVADCQYKCTNYYTPAAEAVLAWNDPSLAVAWPLAGPPVLSPRDQRGMSLDDYLRKPAFRYE